MTDGEGQVDPLSLHQGGEELIPLPDLLTTGGSVEVARGGAQFRLGGVSGEALDGGKQSGAGQTGRHLG